MHTDWNGDGKHNWVDSYMDYRLSCGDDSSSGNYRKAGGSYRIPTWILVGIALSILSGDIPACALSVIVLFVLAIVIWIRMLS